MMCRVLSFGIIRMAPSVIKKTMFMVTALAMVLLSVSVGAQVERQVDEISVNAQANAQSGQAGFIIKGQFSDDQNPVKEKLKFFADIDGQINIEPELVNEVWEIALHRLRGTWDEFEIAISDTDSQMEISLDRHDGIRYSIALDPEKRMRRIHFVVDESSRDASEIRVQMSLVHSAGRLIRSVEPTQIEIPAAEGTDGKLSLKCSDILRLKPDSIGSGFILTGDDVRDEGDFLSTSLEFLIQGGDSRLRVGVYPKEPDQFSNSFRDFKLESDFDNDTRVVKMTLTGVADIKNPSGGMVAVAGGEIGVVSYSLSNTEARMIYRDGIYYISGDTPMEVSLTFRFHCLVREDVQKQSINVVVADSALRPVILNGWDRDSSFDIYPLGDIEWDGDEARGFLKPEGGFNLTWKAKAPEVSQKVFYSVQSVAQTGLGSGRLTQSVIMDFRIMQGELSRLDFNIRGEGEIVRVTGEDILSWKILPSEAGDGRVLTIETRRPVKGLYQARVYTQQTLPAFPASIRALKLTPVGALAFGGYTRIYNEGAVKLEIADTESLTQISPERFPGVNGLENPTGSQIFAYRFSGPDYDFSIQADTILPEVAASQVTIHNLGRNSQSVEAMFELDIREAPLREYEFVLPPEYVLTRLEGNQVADYFLTSQDDGTQLLKIVYSRPVTGRWTCRLELSRNQPLPEGSLELPEVTASAVKSSRGHIGIVAEQGLRVSTSQIEGLTEVASAFFPKSIDGLALAYRLRDADWSLSLGIEELEQSIQADTLQLYSVGEGMIYGSSLLNYLISGSPVSSLQVTASEQYSNVEFVGKGIRNWRKIDGGYEVFLENPTFGTYSLLATYDLKLTDEQETYPFEGIHPVTARNNQGYIIFISHFQVELGSNEIPAESNIVVIEPAEIPSEYRLLFDSPLVRSYQYSSYPFELDLSVNQLERGNSLQILTDRVEVVTDISADGQTVHKADYFIKNKGNPYIRYSLPDGLELWEVKVDNEIVVPVSDNGDILIPVKVKANPNELIPVSLRLARKPDSTKRMSVELPQVDTSTLVTHWTVRSVDGKVLKFHGSPSSLEPENLVKPQRGYDQLNKVPSKYNKASDMVLVCVVILAVGLGFLLVFSHLKARYRIWGWMPVKWTGLSVLGLAVLGLIASCLVMLGSGESVANATELKFSVPVHSTDEVQSIELSVVDSLGLWISCPAVILFFFGVILGLGAIRTNRRPVKFLLLAGAWGLIFGGVLVQYDGLPLFVLCAALLVILQIIIPISKLREIVPPAKPGSSETTDESAGGLSGAVTAWILIGILLAASPSQVSAQPAIQRPQGEAQQLQQQSAQQVPVIVDNVERISQQITVEENFLNSRMELSWRATAGEQLQILGSEAVMMSIHFNAKEGIRLVQKQNGQKNGTSIFAESDGAYKISVHYKVPVRSGNNNWMATMPVPASLSHIINVNFGTSDMEFARSSIVSVGRVSSERFEYRLVMKPQPSPVLTWQPRSRDARQEKAVFFAELSHLFIPAAGVIDGVHRVTVRPAQGQLTSLDLKVHDSLTIVDVPDKRVRSWRFDPDTRVLTVDFVKPESQPFQFGFLSQASAGSLPYEVEIGLIHIPGASSELGFAGVAAPQDVQLDSVIANGLAVLSLEDFASPLADAGASQNLTLRRAYQYSARGGTLRVNVSPVEPDVRVQTRQTLSLGEDRTLLAVTSDFNVTRSGIFKIQFRLPTGLEVESLSGAQVSHWTQYDAPEGGDSPIVTIHLKSRTLGNTPVQVNLVGMGMLDGDNLDVPVISFEEATKQTGTLIVAPELGVRLYPDSMSGVIQRDTASAGVRQKGAVVFSLLQKDWNLSFGVEKVNAWLQANHLQKVTLREGLVRTDVEIMLDIENAGIDSVRLELPAEAESVEVTGESVVDSIRTTADEGGSALWDIRFERRLIGKVPLRIRYQQSIPPQTNQWAVDLVEVQDVNLSRSWVTFQAEGRLRVESTDANQGFQPADWSTIPSFLRGNTANTEDFVRVLRKVNDVDALNLQVVRSEIERVLPARILSTRLTSVVSLSGQMLTMVELTMDPGEERQIVLKLPEKAEFWLGYINEKSIWPWKDGDNLLLPIEKNATEGENSVFKFIYFQRFSDGELENGEYSLNGPAFGLPLEDIEWLIALPKSVDLEKVKGNLDLIDQPKQSVSRIKTRLTTVTDYLASNEVIIAEQNNSAVEYLNLGNRYMISGDNGKAQIAFENALNFSQADRAFNEDVRVQFQNFRSQQATLALNARINTIYNKKVADSLPADYSNLSQNEIEELLVLGSEEDREAIQRLADRLVRQQEAAVARPASMYATFPPVQNSWNLHRSHLVDRMDPLSVDLKIRRVSSGFSMGQTLVAVVGSLVIVGLVLGVIAGIIRILGMQKSSD